MARIAGVDLPPNKRIEIGLTYIYGIGRSQANNILKAAGVNTDTKVRELNDDEVNKIRKVIEEQHRVEGDLRKEISFNIKRLMDLGCYRGLRHRRAPPSSAGRSPPAPGGRACRRTSPTSSRHAGARRCRPGRKWARVRSCPRLRGRARRRAGRDDRDDLRRGDGDRPVR